MSPKTGQPAVRIRLWRLTTKSQRTDAETCWTATSQREARHFAVNEESATGETPGILSVS